MGIRLAPLSGNNEKYSNFLYVRLQRSGLLFRDFQRRVNQNRNVFPACTVANGGADAVVTGLTRSTTSCLKDIANIIDPAPNKFTSV